MAAGAVEARAIADHIEAAMLRAGMVPEQLARRSGVARTSLDRKLGPKPEAFRLDELAQIAEALEVTFEELWLGERVPA